MRFTGNRAAGYKNFSVLNLDIQFFVYGAENIFKKRPKIFV